MFVQGVCWVFHLKRCYWAIFSSDQPSFKVKLNHTERGTLYYGICFVIAASGQSFDCYFIFLGELESMTEIQGLRIRDIPELYTNNKIDKYK